MRTLTNTPAYYCKVFTVEAWDEDVEHLHKMMISRYFWNFCNIFCVFTYFYEFENFTLWLNLAKLFFEQFTVLYIKLECLPLWDTFILVLNLFVRLNAC